MHYKHVTIVNDESSVINEWSFKIIDDTRVIIYDRNRFINQPTGLAKASRLRQKFNHFTIWLE